MALNSDTFTKVGQFIHREIREINVAGLTACPANGGDTVAWPELDAAIAIISLFATVEQVGAFEATDTEVNMLISGMAFEGDQYTDGTETFVEFLSTQTGETVTEVAI
jgi:hypothetical protein